MTGQEPPGREPSPTGLPALDALRRKAGVREYTCGLCGEEFGSNLSPGDIQCTNDDCEARRCPACEAWFTEGGESSLDLRGIPALREQVRLADERRDEVERRMLALAARLENEAAASNYALEGDAKAEAAASIRKGLDV